ncbi:hypothetical protein Q5A_012415 [Serratia inhibens PRI-2C]|nr:hypothetical protein Q5A_012415 [Serratia inhibens PRI-2C]
MILLMISISINMHFIKSTQKDPSYKIVNFR